MANEFHQQSLRRKVIYLALIALLFCGTVALRSHSNPYNLDDQANALALREESMGDVDLTDKALRLTLTGSRGFAVCGLWYAAREKQEKHEWNELEMLVRSVIKLQPHFVTPWLYQSWNLAYNVCAECDRVKDKYFYITQGVGLLAEGERINRDNCDMRFFVGNYTQQKMGISDENHTLRSLFQMSCIDPAERDPARFRRIVNGRTVIDMDQFEDFCRKHPMLVRRLHDWLRCKKPDDVIDFLAANQKIPCRYEDRQPGSDSEQAAAYKPLNERWPVLPPAQKFDPDELTYDSYLGDDFDNYAAARAWYGYALDPVDAGLRHPRFMMQIIFEGYPARAQAYVGERREEEGWFGCLNPIDRRRDGWDVKNWFPRDRANPGRGTQTVRLGTEREWAREAWEKAFDMYKRYASTKGLMRSEEEVHALNGAQLYQYNRYREVTNIEHHYHKARIERTPEAITARMLFFRADELRKAGEREQALALYDRPEAIAAWKKILMDKENAVFRQDQDMQEDTYVLQRKYLSLVRDKRAQAIREMLFVQDALTQAAMDSSAAPAWACVYLVPELRTPIRGPFDEMGPENKPLLSARAIESALAHYNLSRNPEQPLPVAQLNAYQPPKQPVRPPPGSTTIGTTGP